MRLAGEVMRTAKDSKDRELLNFVVKEYERGNHLVDGGNEIGIFWATNISGIETHEPRPLENGLSLLGKYGGLANHRHLMDASKHSF